MEEQHYKVDGVAMSASLFDFGVYFFHNAAELLKQNLGPYFYLPKMEPNYIKTDYSEQKSKQMAQ